MNKLFHQVLPFAIIAGEIGKSLEEFMESHPAVAPFSVKYNQTAQEINHVYRSLLPLNMPRGSNIGVYNFRKI